MMYRIDDNVYETLYEALIENCCDDTVQFDEWLNQNYKASELISSYENHWHRWYSNLTDWVHEELYMDFLNEMVDNEEFLNEFDIEKIKDYELMNEDDND